MVRGFCGLKRVFFFILRREVGVVGGFLGFFFISEVLVLNFICFMCFFFRTSGVFYVWISERRYRGSVFGLFWLSVEYVSVGFGGVGRYR